LVHQVILNTPQSYSACCFVAAQLRNQTTAPDRWVGFNAVAPVTDACDSQPNVDWLLTIP
jgi:hypothetical protein